MGNNDLMIKIIHDFLKVSQKIKIVQEDIEKSSTHLKMVVAICDILFEDFQKVKQALELYQKGEK